MSTAGRLKYFYFAYFSKPAADRTLYRDVRRRRASKILMVGLPSVTLAMRLMQVAGDVVKGDEVQFAAIDLFEARPKEHAAVGLKDAYRILKTSGHKVQLIPGDPQSAISRSANALVERDLILISSEFDRSTIGSSWFYVPRMLHATTRVYLEARDERGEATWQPIEHAEIERLAADHRPRRAA